MPKQSNRSPIDSEESLYILLDIVDNHATGVREVDNCTIDGSDVMRGNGIIPRPEGNQFIAWRIDPNEGMIGYRGVTPTQDSEAIWQLLREDALGLKASKRSGMKLNCKVGNIQCGGKCQNGHLNCWWGLSPEEKKNAQRAARLAKKKGGTKGGGGGEDPIKPKPTPKPEPKPEPKLPTKEKKGKTPDKKTELEEKTDQVLTMIISRARYNVLSPELSNKLMTAEPDVKALIKARADSDRAKEKFFKAPIGEKSALGKEIAAADDEVKRLEEKLAWVKGSMQNARDYLLDSSGITRKEAIEIVKKINIAPNTFKSDAEQRLFTEDAIEFFLITGGRGSTVKGLEETDPRAHANLETKIINIGVGDLKANLFHEFAHVLEVEQRGRLALSEAWVQRRATGKLQTLSSITGNKAYRRNEKAFPDDFVHPYVGKKYNGASEVLSVGFEHFASAKGMANLFLADPEHFYLTLGLIKS